MKETNFQIPTKDQHLIHGILNRRPGNKKLIIFVHGLTGNANEHIFFNSSRFFPGKGFDTARIFLYCDGTKARKLTQCSIATHSSDLNQIIQHFAGKYPKLFIVGHSLGGPVVMKANLKPVSGIVLWDPSWPFNKRADYLKYNRHLDKYIVDWGMEILLSKKMVGQMFSLDQFLSKKQHLPTRILQADNKFHLLREKFYKNLLTDYQFQIIKGAGHCFDEADSEKQLLQATLKFFKFIN